MNRFLKREWDSAEIPEALRVGARNRAWRRLHPPPATSGNRRVLAAALAAATVLVAVVVIQWPTALRAPQPRLPIAARSIEPLAPERPELAPAAAGATGVAPGPAAATARPRRLAAAPLRKDPPERSEKITAFPHRAQLVSTFQLAKTGVRMIWVQDANFLKETGDSP